MESGHRNQVHLHRHLGPRAPSGHRQIKEHRISKRMAFLSKVKNVILLKHVRPGRRPEYGTYLFIYLYKLEQYIRVA